MTEEQINKTVKFLLVFKSLAKDRHLSICKTPNTVYVKSRSVIREEIIVLLDFANQNKLDLSIELSNVETVFYIKFQK